MARLVLKFGGTSVGDAGRIRRVAERVVRERRAGHEVVVVVSAMGHTTDELITLAKQIAADPQRRHPRELDMLLTAGERIAIALLAMAIREVGVPALSFTGSQAAIITDEVHTGARIEEVRAERVRDELGNGNVVIVAGFQGVSRRREITTLGRGGSDTTAVALAAALGAERCDIYTDVDGVYTADPRHVPEARRIDVLNYAEMLELAQSGAKVMHARAVEIGQRFRVPIRVLSAFEDDPRGTLITRTERPMEGLVLTGLAAEPGHAAVLLRGVPAAMKSTTAVLSGLAAAGVSVDMVAQLDRPDRRRDVQVTLREDDLEAAIAVCQALVGELGGEDVETRSGLSRLALVGSGMTGRPGVFAAALEALLEADVEVHAVNASAISIVLLVDATQQEAALRRLHDAFTWAEVPA